MAENPSDLEAEIPTRDNTLIRTFEILTTEEFQFQASSSVRGTGIDDSVMTKPENTT